MRPDDWERFKAAAKGRAAGPVAALIVDSPWIPGALGLGHLDYYFDPEAWFEANLEVHRALPGAVLLPSFWVEFGMAAEPSALGARVRFHADRTPECLESPASLAALASQPLPDPRGEGWMGPAVHLYRRHRDRIRRAGHIVPMVAARGPLCTAGFLRGIGRFTLDLAEDPEGVHRLLDLTTRLTIEWLAAQAEAAGDTVEGILLLDDIVGLLGRRHYLDFAHPYLARIFAAFPEGWVKVYHNDAGVKPFAADLAGTGLDVLNWGTVPAAAALRALVGERVVLMGNVPPLDVAVRGTPEEVGAQARGVLEMTQGRNHILSLGGGVSPGTPLANLAALVAAAGG